jgi:hypothetical protein
VFEINCTGKIFECKDRKCQQNWMEQYNSFMVSEWLNGERIVE